MDRNKGAANFPTNRHPPEQWEELGRTVATFGFLEDVLLKAIVVFVSPTTQYSEQSAQKALDKFDAVIDRSLTDTLAQLADTYGKAVREHSSADFKNVNDLVEDIKKAAVIRNALCHGMWRPPGADGKSELDYFNRQNKKPVKFASRIDIAWMLQVREHVVTLIYNVINSVTVMGYQFPGGAGPGSPILPGTT
jgi:hypothetical protein